MSQVLLRALSTRTVNPGNRTTAEVALQSVHLPHAFSTAADVTARPAVRWLGIIAAVVTGSSALSLAIASGGVARISLMQGHKVHDATCST